MKRATFWTLPLFLLISVGLFKWMRTEAWYRRKGEPVKARVTQIKDNTATEMEEPVWRLKAIWVDPNSQKTYTFEKIFPDRPNYRAGDFINVLVDPKDPSGYLIG